MTAAAWPAVTVPGSAEGRAKVEAWRSNVTELQPAPRDALAREVAAVDRLRRQVERGAAATPASSTWVPADLSGYLDGSTPEVVPMLGVRADGTPLLYPGRVHSLAGESEGGKTWLALFFAAQEMQAGYRVTYLDLEDEPAGIVGRLRTLGVAPDVIRERFLYVTPRNRPDAGWRDFLAALPGWAPACRLVVVDATTELLALLGLSSKDDTDVAAMLEEVPRAVARLGPAVLLLDHLVKAREAQGRYATGSQHKLSGVTGAAYLLESVSRFAAGRDGRSRLRVAKDRPGQVRPACLPGRDGTDWAADLVLEHLHGRPVFTLDAPQERTDAEPFKPTAVMAKVAAALSGSPEPLNKAGVCERVTGRAQVVRQALAALVDDGYVTTSRGANGADLHSLAKPYPDASEGWQ